MSDDIDTIDPNDPVFQLPPYTLEYVAVSLAETVDWGLNAFKVPELWKITKGKGIKVAVLDTGAALGHPDLAAAIASAKDFTGSAFGPDDKKSGHGSHCAGIVGARQNNTGIVGVAPEVSLYIAKVLGDNGAGSMASIIAGIQWSIDQKVDIISMSLGSSQGYSKLQDIIKVATAAGIIVICAAGNEGPGPNTVGYPANYPEVISVAAIGKNLTVTNFSSRGNRIDVAAPGDNILSCYPPTGYAALSGTSMATPFVAGLAALLLAVDRLSGNPVINNTEDFRQILKTYSIDAGPAGKDTAYGWGLVNPEEYFKAIKKPEAPTEPTPDIKKVTLFDEDLTNSGVVKLVYASGDSIGPDGIEVTVK